MCLHIFFCRRNLIFVVCPRCNAVAERETGADTVLERHAPFRPGPQFIQMSGFVYFPFSIFDMHMQKKKEFFVRMQCWVTKAQTDPLFEFRFLEDSGNLLLSRGVWGGSGLARARSPQPFQKLAAFSSHPALMVCTRRPSCPPEHHGGILMPKNHFFSLGSLSQELRNFPA
jgi:hypothetical protein